MGLQSKNMNYIFNVEYFEGIALGKKEDKDSVERLNSRNKEMKNFLFKDAAPIEAYREIEGYRDFSVYTLYPGLLVGTGNPHGIAMAGALKLGFSFDYVTGLPYIPGSSLKGMLRAYFPGETTNKKKDKEYQTIIKDILGKEVDVMALKEDIFENNDIFLGAFPVASESGTNAGTKGKLLELEYITPHKDKFKNPNPISLIKVRPAVKFVFSFVLSDYYEGTKEEKEAKKAAGEPATVTAEEKRTLFKELVILMGIGAKTNTGFGRFSEERPKQNNLGHIPELTQNTPICKICGKNPLKKIPNTEKYYNQCWECSQKQKRR